MKLLKQLFPGLGIAVVMSTGASAGTVQWGGTISSTSNFESDGDNLENDIGDVLFELGIFQPGFVPDRGNIADWAANWQPLPGTGVDALYNGNDPGGSSFFGADSTDPVIVGTGAGEANNTDFPIGSQVYIWGYNSQDLTQNPEWFLVTGENGTGSSDTNWEIPTDQGGNAAFTFIWDINNASTAVVGRIDDTTGSTPGISVFPTLEADDIQFEIVPDPSLIVPEPSSILLSFLGLGLCLRRSRN